MQETPDGHLKDKRFRGNGQTVRPKMKAMPDRQSDIPTDVTQLYFLAEQMKQSHI